MNLLPAPDLATAQSFDDRAWDYCKAQGNHGSAWSDIWSNGTQYGIVWDPSIAPAFTQEEIDSVIPSDPSWTVYQPAQDNPDSP